MAIERLGGTPDDPNRQSPDDSAHPAEDESRISAADSGPATPPAADEPVPAESAETQESAEAEPAAAPTERIYGKGGHTIPMRASGESSPATPTSDSGQTAPTSADLPAPTEAPQSAAASAHPAEPGAPSGPAATPPGGGPTATREFETPPTFEMPVPSVESGVPLGAPPVEPRRGRIQRQELGVTTPRPPTVAEARAREKARKRAEEAEQAALETAENKRKKKKKVLLGSAAVVGVAALVGGGYLAYDALTTPEVTAYCTVIAKKDQQVAVGNGQTITATADNQEIVVPDNYCDDAQRSGGGGGLGGIFLLNGSQYRYYYGGNNNTIGHAPTGGTTVVPKGADVKTKSGSTIQRGGLGSKISGGGS